MIHRNFEIPDDLSRLCTNDYDFVSDFFDLIMGDDFLRFLRMHTVPQLSGLLPSGIAKHLDLCCGTGGFLVEVMDSFGAEGWGIDLSGGQIEQAKLRCREHNVHCILERADIREADFPELCDLVSINFDSLNHIKTPSEWHLIFTKVYASLRCEGVLIFDVNTPQRLLHDWDYPEVIVRDEFTYISLGLEPEITPSYVRRASPMFVFVGREGSLERRVGLVEHTAIEDAEIFRMLSDVGFTDVRHQALPVRASHEHIFLKNRTFYVCRKS